MQLSFRVYGSLVACTKEEAAATAAATSATWNPFPLMMTRIVQQVVGGVKEKKAGECGWRGVVEVG